MHEYATPSKTDLGCERGAEAGIALTSFAGWTCNRATSPRALAPMFLKGQVDKMEAMVRSSPLLPARRSEEEKPAIANGEEGGMDEQTPRGSRQVQRYDVGISTDALRSKEQ